VSDTSATPILGPAELAELLGVTPGRVRQLRAAGKLPAPWAVLASGPVWRREDAERYAARRRTRPGRPRSNATSAR
jgi:hypothetical protein